MTTLASLGHDPKNVFDRAQSTENKAALRRQTEAAQSHGMFGSPSFFAGRELFWGDDRLEEAVAWAQD